MLSKWIAVYALASAAADLAVDFYTDHWVTVAIFLALSLVQYGITRWIAGCSRRLGAHDAIIGFRQKHLGLFGVTTCHTQATDQVAGDRLVAHR
jgi:hypothetical protein